MIYFCCDLRRRNAVRGSALNGIDFVEVRDLDAPTEDERQKRLYVHLLNDHSGTTPGIDNVRVEGGERIDDIAVIGVSVGSGSEADVITVDVDKPGDFSVYTLRLVLDATHDEPPVGFDPQLAVVDFSFKAECPSDFDCRSVRVCPREKTTGPDIDYLAKDYAGFRRLMLDRMAVLAPQWTERNPADLGVALVEILAHVGDQLSYQQDAVATEAFLGTAHNRISVRRHARLVDYFISDGCNARCWVALEVSADVTKPPASEDPVLPAGTALATRISGRSLRVPSNSEVLAEARAVFETVEPLQELYAAHNELPFYTWSDHRCCLPKGATHATLRGHYPKLAVGDLVILEEVRGPLTGNGADADPARRHAIRLTRVDAFDPDDDPLVDPLTSSDPDPREVTEIYWDRADALPMAFCISATPERGGGTIDDVSIARGNIVLADHGMSLEDREIGKAPNPGLYRPKKPADDRCRRTGPEPVPPRFRPLLLDGPLTHSAPHDADKPASAASTIDHRKVMPVITLEGRLNTDVSRWRPKRDLLASGPSATEFVVETERDGRARLRMGDDAHGARPEPGATFKADYRIGNGTAGNIGAESLVHIASTHPEIISVRNPLPAWGGTDAETIEDVRQRAPSAFKTQERAVSAEDYADVTERMGGIQKAAASFRWTGSWHTVFLTADRLGGGDVDEDFERDVRDHVEKFRMAGYDLEVDRPDLMSLEIELEICVAPDHFRSHVHQTLLDVLSNRMRRDGRRGVFHPDNFSFGDTVYLSAVVAAVQAVPGVDGVRAKTFQRLQAPGEGSVETGKLEVASSEIARLDNDPNFPENGVLRLRLEGGK